MASFKHSNGHKKSFYTTLNSEPRTFEPLFNVFFNSFKTAAVDGAEAKYPYGLLMSPGRVSFVSGKVELGIIMMVSLHQAIPGDLGDNRCGGDGDA